jgi:hypothetical protein
MRRPFAAFEFGHEHLPIIIRMRQPTYQMNMLATPPVVLACIDIPLIEMEEVPSFLAWTDKNMRSRTSLLHKTLH